MEVKYLYLFLLEVGLGLTYFNCSHAPDKASVPAPPTSAQDCMNIPCICSFLGGQMKFNGCRLPNGRLYQKSLRKEYRMLSDQERYRVHYAIQEIKASGEYDRLSLIHKQVATGSGAHTGPGFLPWHREYMKRFEIALKALEPELSLPYWDSVLDSYLPDPTDSIMFTLPFIGEIDNDGQLTKGPFGSFRTLEGHSHINRSLAKEGKLFTEKNIQDVMSQIQIHNVLAYTAPQSNCPFRPNFVAIEYSHAYIHLFMGGDMKPPSTSANDPIFFLHHTFVDNIWEMWRQLRQVKSVRDQLWAPDIDTCTNSKHFSKAPMIPWNKINKDGLSNDYTDNLYEYASRPSCTFQNPNCGSKYLFCDTRGTPHCVSKVKPYGKCNGFEGFDVCWDGTCVIGICRPNEDKHQTLPPFHTTTTTPVPITQAQAQPAATTQTSAVSQTNCYNEDPCCEGWTRQGLCRLNPDYMNAYCRKSCGFCTNPNDIQQGCHDRHSGCTSWRTQNYCVTRPQWMAENCQSSCGWCSYTKEQMCSLVTRRR